MKKNWLYLAFMAIPLVGGLTACDNEDIPTPTTDPEPTTTYGAYIVNTGNWGANDGSIQWFDMASQTVSSDLYQAQNGKGFGNVQDLCVYGSKMYAIGSTSSKIEILDLQGKLIKSIPLNNGENQPIQPRYATAAEGCVFFSAYDGTVSKLDTLSQEITGSVEVGAYPEALTCVDGKLYVNISGYGSGDKVAVVDVKSWTKTSDITVKLNPYTVCFDGKDGYVYVVSNGNYAGGPNLPEDKWIYQTLQRINVQTNEVEDVCNATYAAKKGDNIYVLYAEYYLPERNSCFVYNVKTKEQKEFIDINDVPSPGGIAVDPVSEDVYIISQPYGSLNDVYVYSKDGQFKKKFETGNATTNIRFLAE
ncbi:YncE family protein [Bacteroides mediterraneensis]|uniref:YncE family protein n=1 Tax=Bacteroides mediterraneensis TaxID=1841856 RepID=A0ABS2EXK2_9BACE|nr:DUF5074 domain-containing protein [Bacteroides mediterraneensis]MBM6759321.1 hypothetical protein [Bacteroides mediterraneensis]